MDTSVSITTDGLFSGKDLVVVITGGGTGIGRVFAAALVKTGAKKVFLLGRRTDPLNTAAESLNVGSAIVVPIQCDVTSKDSIASAVSQIEKDVGYIDVLINNAGIIGPRQGDVYKATSVADLQNALLNNSEGGVGTYATNSQSVMIASALFLGLLDAGNKRRGWESGSVVRERARGRDMKSAAEGIEEGDRRTSQIITVASIAAFNRFITAGIPYSASKVAAVHTGKMLSTLLAPWGIRSNIICPGVYPSEMTTAMPLEHPPEKIPAGRMGSLDDMAGLILYLVGRGGAYVNGDVQITDGGRLSVHPSTY